MPAAARGLKKNLSGTWGSKTSDKKHSFAALGHAEIPAVEHAPRNPIPALHHENPEDFRKVSPFVAREKSGNIFEDKPTGSKFTQAARKLVKEASTLAFKARALPGDADILTGHPSGDAPNFFTSWNFGTFGQCRSRTRRQNLSCSTCAIILQPSRSSANPKPSMPEKRLMTVRVLLTLHRLLAGRRRSKIP